MELTHYSCFMNREVNLRCTASFKDYYDIQSIIT
jgi:hypothetical protein